MRTNGFLVSVCEADRSIIGDGNLRAAGGMLISEASNDCIGSIET